MKKTRHVFVKHGFTRRQQSQTMAYISKSYILTPPQPQGQVMSVNCEEPLGELTQCYRIFLIFNFPLESWHFKFTFLEWIFTFQKVKKTI